MWKGGAFHGLLYSNKPVKIFNHGIVLVIDLHGNDISLVFLKRRGFVWVLTNHPVQALIGVLQVSGTRQVHWQDLLLVLDLGGHRSKELFQYLESQETNILCEQFLVTIHLEQV